MTLNFKQMKFIIISLAVALVLFAGWSIYTSVDYGKGKANFLQDKVERETRIRILELEKAEAETKASLNAKAAKVVAKERDLIASRLERAYKEQEERIEEVEKMEPDDVVRVTQRLLEMGLEDIYRNPEGVQFSFAAAKRCVISLTYLDFYLKIEKPGLVDFSKKAVEEAKYWHEAYATLSEGALKDAEGIIVELREQVVEDNAQLKRAEKRLGQVKLITAVKTGIAIGVTYVVVRGIIKLVGK